MESRRFRWIVPFLLLLGLVTAVVLPIAVLAEPNDGGPSHEENLSGLRLPRVPTNNKAFVRMMRSLIEPVSDASASPGQDYPVGQSRKGEHTTTGGSKACLMCTQ